MPARVHRQTGLASDEYDEDLISEDGNDIEEEVDGVPALDGLLVKLRELDLCGEKFTEITYSVNDWTLGGVLPMQHHGLALRTSKGKYLTLDFCRQGIDWWFGDEATEPADRTFLILRYKTRADPLLLLVYCAASEPFAWLGNNCKTWSEGVLQLFNVKDAPCEDLSPGLKTLGGSSGKVVPAKGCYRGSTLQAVSFSVLETTTEYAYQPINTGELPW